MKIRFKLRDIDNIVPWGKLGKRSLSWFALTDGIYCIDTPAGRLLEHTEAADPELGEPWCGYQVVRLFEDLTDAWPHICEPVPANVADRHAAWHTDEVRRHFRSNDFDRLEPYYGANSWWTARLIDFRYLSAYPELHLRRIESDVRLAWRTPAPWQPATATVAIPFSDVHSSVASFVGEFMAAMRDRVADIERRGWTPADCSLDIPGLVAEQSQREEQAAAALARVQATDWALVRRCLGNLGA